jgi:hypothetical protein
MYVRLCLRLKSTWMTAGDVDDDDKLGYLLRWKRVKAGSRVWR